MSESLAPGSHADKLLRAHIAHELSLFEEAELKRVLEGELPLLYDWAAERTPEELAPRAEMAAFARRALIEAKPEQASLDFGLEMARTLLGSLRDRKEKGSDVLSREAYDRAAATIGEDEQLRRTGVHLMVNNAVFAMVISETLYHGIEDFMTQSKLTQTIPGAQSLFKLGQDMLSSAVPALKDNFEKTIKEFIKNNAGNIIKSSEEFLNRSLGPETIKEAADQVWRDAVERPVSELPDLIGEDKLANHRDIAQAFAENFRGTELFAHLIDRVLDFYYERFGDKPLNESLKTAGLTKELLVTEVVPPVLNLARRARESGYLEGVIERRLRSFYESPAAAELLD